jgi:siroheme synthase-like protein
MGYLVNLLLDGKQTVVVGGGLVAARKIGGLLAAGATVRVVAAEACEEIRMLAARGAILAAWRPYAAGDLEGAVLAVAATDDEPVNARIAADARARNIPVNVVDCPALCTFTLPAVVRRRELTIAISTNGLCPSLSAALREEIEERYGPEYGELAGLFGELRQQMTAMGWDGKRIARAVLDLYRGGIVSVISAGGQEQLEEFLRGKLGPGFPLTLRKSDG